MLEERIEQLVSNFSAADLDIIALLPGPSLYYLTGLSFHLMERPVVMLIPSDDPPTLILPELEAAKAEHLSSRLCMYKYGEDDSSRSKAFQDAVRSLNTGPLKVGIEPLRFRIHELRLLEDAAPNWEFINGEVVLSKLRIIKNLDEQDKMQRAVEIAETALQATFPHIKAGMTERELASELFMQLLGAGSEADLPFEPIVASGPNSALPHATPTDRKLQHGDLLLIDWGARHAGYISDLTRTYTLGEPDSKLATLHEIVLEANRSGRSAVAPDRMCGEIDKAARQVIEARGYGSQFIHRTGHGIGLETHEPPYIRDDNERKLVSGMTFTVEPGIYLLNEGGVRIEDDVLVTEEGGRSLSTLPRELEVIA
jgi:Xaa-Pro dipeptidase